MTLSVIIPSGAKDYSRAKSLASFCLSRGAYEAIVETSGHTIAQARNIGIAKSHGDEILILDEDMILPEQIRLDRLKDYRFDVATAWYETIEPLDYFIPELHGIYRLSLCNVRRVHVLQEKGI